MPTRTLQDHLQRVHSMTLGRPPEISVLAEAIEFLLTKCAESQTSGAQTAMTLSELETRLDNLEQKTPGDGTVAE